MMTVKLLSSPGSVATRGGPGLPHGVKITVLHVRGAVPSCMQSEGGLRRGATFL